DSTLPFLRLHAERQAGPADERDLPAVDRPRRRGVAIDARRHEIDAARARIVDADERVIVAVAHERDLAAVRRPAGIALTPPLLDQGDEAVARGRRRVRRYARAEDLAVADVERGAPVR